MDQRKDQVRKFYEILWNQNDLSVLSQIIDESFTFRGSLGQEKRGHQGFSDYVDMVHTALGNYHCSIEELVAENRKVFAKMMFSGIHRGEFLGYAPSEQELSWHGCALFTFGDVLIEDVWVLGDLKNLEAQLKNNCA